MAPTGDKNFIEEFISCYRNNSVLWDTTSKEYFQNKTKKDESYKELLDILQKYKKGGTLEEVKRKINTLRSTYRKELKKIKQSESSGAGLDDVYVQTVWWFDSLDFLNHLEKPVESVSSIIDTTDNENDNASDFETSFSRPPKKKTKTSKQEDLLSAACDYLMKPKPETDDTFLATSKTWAMKLKSLSSQRQLVVEKKINDLFFEAQMEELQTGQAQTTYAPSSSRHPLSTTFTHRQSRLNHYEPCNPSNESVIPSVQRPECSQSPFSSSSNEEFELRNYYENCNLDFD